MRKISIIKLFKKSVGGYESDYFEYLQFAGVQFFTVTEEEFNALNYFCGSTRYSDVQYVLVEPIVTVPDFENVLETAKFRYEDYSKKLEAEKKRVAENLKKKKEKTKEQKLRQLEKLKKELNVA